MSTPRIAGALLGLAYLALAGSAAAETTVEVRLEPDVVRPDGTVQFTIEAEGDGIQQPRLRPRFELQNLDVVGGPDQTHGLRMGLGGGGWHYSWTWYLRPRSLGAAAVTSIRLLVGDREIELAPERIRVSPEGSTGRRPRERGRPETLRERRLGEGRSDPKRLREAPEIFVRAVTEPAAPYVGQRTVYTAYLYTRVPVRGMEPVELPRFDGCWAREVEVEGGRETVVMEGTRYSRVPLYRRELYPLRAGVLELGAVSARFVIERMERNRRFFPPARVPDQVVRESNRIQLAVRALPEPEADLTAPFDGAVGRMELTARLEPSEVPVGRGATLTVTARGEGHMEALRPPPLQVPEGIEILGPQQGGTEGPNGESGRAAPGRRAWSYLLVPRRSGSWDLPPVEVVYFDPSAGRYRIAASGTTRLEAVAHGEHSADDAARAPHSIRSAALPGPARHRWERLLPWAFGIPWVLALALLAARHRGVVVIPWGGSASSPAARNLERFHRDLDVALQEDRPRRAARGIERAWRRLLAEAHEVPEAGPASGWPEELERRGVGRDLCRRLASLLEDLHFLRYAPELSDAAALAGELTARSGRLGRKIVDQGR